MKAWLSQLIITERRPRICQLQISLHEIRTCDIFKIGENMKSHSVSNDLLSLGLGIEAMCRRRKPPTPHFSKPVIYGLEHLRSKIPYWPQS